MSSSALVWMLLIASGGGLVLGCILTLLYRRLRQGWRRITFTPRLLTPMQPKASPPRSVERH